MKSERHEALLSIVNEAGRVEVVELAQRLGVSEITARRDLLELEADGFLRRVHGGAVPVSGRSSERPFRVREQQQSAGKEAIAKAAAKMVNSGDAIALDVGSTVLHMIDHLGHAANLTIVTANLRTAWAVANSRTLMRPFRLIVSGGVVREDELSMTGESALAHFRKMRVDIAFLGVAGVDPRAGVTDFNLDDVEIKRHLVESARKTVVLADHTKLGEVNFAQVADLHQLDLLITDTQAPRDQVDELRRAGLEIMQAKP
jgi:DeoR/GlpR family transcriptional regulator of sugar metabolism